MSFVLSVIPGVGVVIVVGVCVAAADPLVCVAAAYPLVCVLGAGGE